MAATNVFSEDIMTVNSSWIWRFLKSTPLVRRWFSRFSLLWPSRYAQKHDLHDTSLPSHSVEIKLWCRHCSKTKTETESNEQSGFTDELDAAFNGSAAARKRHVLVADVTFTRVMTQIEDVPGRVDRPWTGSSRRVKLWSSRLSVICRCSSKIYRRLDASTGLTDVIFGRVAVIVAYLYTPVTRPVERGEGGKVFLGPATFWGPAIA